MQTLSFKDFLQNAINGISLPVRSLFVTALCLALFWLGAPAENFLVYDRAAVDAGEWWRLMSGQLIHIDGDHLFWDVSAFILLAALVEPKGRTTFWSIMAISFVPIGIFVHLFLPDLYNYAGLSGGLNTLLFITTYDMWKRDGGWLAPAVLVGGALKIIVEIYLQAPLFTSPTLPAVPEVHAVGHMLGALWVYYFGQFGDMHNSFDQNEYWVLNVTYEKFISHCFLRLSFLDRFCAVFVVCGEWVAWPCFDTKGWGYNVYEMSARRAKAPL